MFQEALHSVGSVGLPVSSIRTINTSDVGAMSTGSNLFIGIQVKGEEKMGSSCQT